MGVGDYVACLQRVCRQRLARASRRKEGLPAREEERKTATSDGGERRGMAIANALKGGGGGREGAREQAAATNLRIGDDPGHRRLPVVPLTP